MTQSKSTTKSSEWPHSYPLFVPPEECLADRKVWSRKVARLYFDWVMRVRDNRVRALERYIGIDVHSEEQLHRAAEMVSVLVLRSKIPATTRNKPLGTSPEEEVWMPDNAGYALGADFGLCCARLAESEAQGRLEWTIGRGGKTNVFYNMPVIHAVGEKRLYLHTDPIGQGCSRIHGVIQSGIVDVENLCNTYGAILRRLTESEFDA